MESPMGNPIGNLMSAHFPNRPTSRRASAKSAGSPYGKKCAASPLRNRVKTLAISRRTFRLLVSISSPETSYGTKSARAPALEPPISRLAPSRLPW